MSFQVLAALQLLILFYPRYAESNRSKHLHEVLVRGEFSKRWSGLASINAHLADEAAAHLDDSSKNADQRERYSRLATQYAKRAEYYRNLAGDKNL